jgi:hypothetical protein
VIIVPTPQPDGVVTYSLHRYDAAGNESWSPTASIMIDSTPPAGITNAVISASGVVTFNGSAPENTYEYQIGATGAFTELNRVTSFAVTAAGPIGVRALDIAGNPSVETWITRSVGSPAATPPGSSPANAPPIVLTPKQKRAAKAAAHAKAVAAARAQRIAHAKALRQARAERIAQAHAEAPH